MCRINVNSLAEDSILLISSTTLAFFLGEVETNPMNALPFSGNSRLTAASMSAFFTPFIPRTGYQYCFRYLDLIRLEPAVIRLIVGVTTHHQLKRGAIRISQSALSHICPRGPVLQVQNFFPGAILWFDTMTVPLLFRGHIRRGNHLDNYRQRSMSSPHDSSTS